MGIIRFIFGTDTLVIRKERSDIQAEKERLATRKGYFKAAIAENKAIDVKADKIRAETWKMIRRLDPKIKELGEKIKRFYQESGGIK